MDRVEVKPGYEGLAAVLDDALEQAQSGKGKERHARGEVFEDQLICELGCQVGLGFLLGQAIKKAVESQRLPGKRGIAELHGAINYLAAAALLREQGVGDPGEAAGEEAAGAKPADITRLFFNGGKAEGSKGTLFVKSRSLDAGQGPFVMGTTEMMVFPKVGGSVELVVGCNVEKESVVLHHLFDALVGEPLQTPREAA